MDHTPTPAPPSPPARAPRRRWRWLVWLGLPLAAAVLLLVWWGPILARPLVRDKLQELVRSQLNADLRIGSLEYSFPFGVTVDDAALETIGPNGRRVDIVALPHMEIRLARLPFGAQPLVIRELRLRDPGLHVIRTAEGFVGQGTLLAPDVPARKRYRRSEIFELRLVSITGGRIIYEDRTLPDAVPMVWRGIDAQLTTDPARNPLYDFALNFASGQLAQATAQGRFHIDDLQVTLASLRGELTVDPTARSSPAPPELQQVLSRFEIRGRVGLEASGEVGPVTALQASLKLEGGHVRPLPALPPLEGATGTIRLTTIAPTTLPSTGPTWSAHLPGLEVVIDSLRATVAGRPVETRARLLIKPGTLDWSLPTLSATAALAGPVEGQVQVTITGSGTTWPRPDGRLSIQATAPKLTIPAALLELEDVTFTGLLDRSGLDLPDTGGLRADVFGGALRVIGRVGLEPDRITYRLPLRLADVDLKRLDEYRQAHGAAPQDVAGKFTAEAVLEGSLPRPLPDTVEAALTRLMGRGSLQVTEARLFEIQAITSIVRTIGLSATAGRFQQAAGVFTIADGRLEFSKVAASSPALGIEGSGTLAFDGQLDFRVIAALLDDWRKKIQGAGIPLVGGLIGEIAGGVQKILNTASANLLYQFRITGTVSDVRVTTLPAPILSEGGAQLFQQMLEGGGKLLEAIK